MFLKIKFIESCYCYFDKNSLLLMSHEMTDDRGQLVRYELHYRPLEGGRPSWEVGACMRDKKGMMQEHSIQFSEATQDGVLKVSGRSISLMQDKVLSDELEENMKRFLIHILHSSKIKGIELISEKMYEFNTLVVTKEQHPKPEGFDQVPSFSLDFILQMLV
ncbi:MAG: hypothetical protein JSR46_07165 [Verrucomicrobia bacterium]|nr:hypothetical protein [Verrucomicrobiota bacterium]